MKDFEGKDQAGELKAFYHVMLMLANIPLRGSSYIDLLEKIKNKQCCVDVKNNDNKCFMWSISFALHPIDRKNHPDRVTKYKQYDNNLKFDDINFPVKLDKIPKFEKLNNININVFGYDEKYKIFPLQISKNNFEKVIDLLFFTNKNTNHYCWIKKFDGLVSKQINKDSHKYFHCKNICMGLILKIY